MTKSVSSNDYKYRVLINLSEQGEKEQRAEVAKDFIEGTGQTIDQVKRNSNLETEYPIPMNCILYNSPENIHEIETKAKNCDTFEKLTIGLGATTAYNFAMAKIAAHGSGKMLTGLGETLKVSTNNGIHVTGGFIPKWGARIAVGAALVDGFADVKDTYNATNGDIMATAKVAVKETIVNGTAAYFSIKGQKFGYTLGSYFGTTGKIVGTIAGGIGGWWVGSELGEGAVDVVGDWFEGDGGGEGEGGE